MENGRQNRQNRMAKQKRTEQNGKISMAKQNGKMSIAEQNGKTGRQTEMTKGTGKTEWQDRKQTEQNGKTERQTGMAKRNGNTEQNRIKKCQQDGTTIAIKRYPPPPRAVLAVNRPQGVRRSGMAAPCEEKSPRKLKHLISDI
jgi:hypothetical protein